MHKGHYAVGTVEGTGAAINIELGFVPEHVVLYNVDGLARLEWTDDLGDGFGIKTITVGTMSKITTLGVSAYAGVEGANSKGFTIGADTDINVSAETINYVAISSDS